MKKIVFGLLAAFFLVSCGQSFKVEGTIANADPDAMVYLEQVTVTKVLPIDSAMLGADGSFRFKAERPQYPDIFRLRVGGKTIILAVDSLDEIGVEASFDDILAVTFEGSPKSQKIADLRKSLRDSLMVAHKQLAKQVILEDPKSVVAYYALFQTKAMQPVFDITTKEDLRFYQAVATAWHTWMPENNRSKSLYQQVVDQLNSDRRKLNNALMQAYIDDHENSFLDIELTDKNGEVQSLSSLKGKVILLDFCSLEIEAYKEYLFSLRDRYNEFHDRGLEIYQVYPDQNKLLWEEQVENLPWVTVRTENGLMSSVYKTYNVQSIPTTFLLNREGEVVGRYVGFANIDEDIRKCL